MALLAPVNWVLEALMLKDAPVAEAAKPDPVRLNWELLQKGNADATSKLLEALRDTETFSKLAADEGAMAASRDRDHKESVQAGVERSLARDTLGPVPTVAITRIDVERKSPEEVAQLILTQLPKNGTAGATVVLQVWPKAPRLARVVLFVGLLRCLLIFLILSSQGQSGTGKGTTTTTLLDKLPNSVSWSNGNVFRSLTLLAATHCKNEGIDLKENVDKVWASFPGCVFFCAVVFVIVSVMPPHTPTSRSSTKVMTPENVARWMSMLRFEKMADKTFDVRLVGMGFNARVSEIQNTILKEPLVAKNVPTVAEWSQVCGLTAGCSS